MPVLKARYGARDNSHSLLWQSDESISPPLELAGLTDRPYGYDQPGEQWWPSFGCGPVGTWWALWWTTPDNEATRKGMVRSEVLIWPLHEIGEIEDIAPFIEELAGNSLPEPPKDLLESLAESLLEFGGQAPVVVGLDHWPSLVSGLWRRLWPEARSSFSGRIALAPPQGGESIAPPVVYAIPGGRALQWPGRKHIAPGSLIAIPGRGARWLAGASDAGIEELITQCVRHPAELGFVSRLARAADSLERLRQTPDCDTAIGLLRTLIALEPGQGMAELKQEALSTINKGFDHASLTAVLSLANIPEKDVPSERLPLTALVRWVSTQIPQLSLSEAIRFLSKAGPSGTQPWWRDSVRNTLKAGFRCEERIWATQVLQCLGHAQTETALNDLLPSTEQVESRLLAVTDGKQLATDQLPFFRSQCGQRHWSRLHAWGVMTALSAEEAIAAQLAFISDAAPGLAYLVDRLPGDVLIEQAITPVGTPLIALTARRTAREPELLRTLNANVPGWRALWAAHVEAGGSHWPDGASRERLGGELLNSVLTADVHEALIAALAPDLAMMALEHPQREQLWTCLKEPSVSLLLKHTAQALMESCTAGKQLRTPESALADEVVRLTRKGKPSARVITALVSWEVGLDEREVVDWLSKSQGAAWAAAAQELGHGVARRSWARMASEMYRLCRWSIPDLRPGVQACLHLLSWWEQFAFSWYAPAQTREVDMDALSRRLAELGAELAADQATDYWERAGGKRKDISMSSRAEAQWRDATSRARNGGLPDGLKALLAELLKDFPHNPSLQELQQILK